MVEKSAQEAWWAGWKQRSVILMSDYQPLAFALAMVGCPLYPMPSQL